MNSETRPPVREIADFTNVHVAGGIAGGFFITVSGTQPDRWQMALEDDPNPSIPEPEWVRWQIVGYHYADYRPDQQPYSVTRQVPPLPPESKGVEIVGKSKAERVPLSP